MQPYAQVLRIKTGVSFFCVAVYLAGIALLLVHLPFGISDHYRFWIVLAFAVLGALWLADILAKRIALGADNIRIISFSDYQCRTIIRTEIEGITWKKGCGAFLIMREGRGIRLPNVGHNPQGLTNTIRAWLKKTEV